MRVRFFSLVELRRREHILVRATVAQLLCSALLLNLYFLERIYDFPSNIGAMIQKHGLVLFFLNTTLTIFVFVAVRFSETPGEKIEMN